MTTQVFITKKVRSFPQIFSHQHIGKNDLPPKIYRTFFTQSILETVFQIRKVRTTVLIIGACRAGVTINTFI